MHWFLYILIVCSISLGLPNSAAHQTETILCSNSIDYYRETSPETIYVMNFAVSPNGRTLLVSSPVGLYIYDAETLQYRETLLCEVDKTSHYIIAWSPDGTQFATFFSTCVGIQIWNATSLEVEETLSFPQDSPYCSDPNPEEPYGFVPSVQGLVWSPDRRYLAAIGGSPFRIWDLEAGEPIFEDNTIQCSPLACVSSLTWSPDSQYLAHIHDCIAEQWTEGIQATEVLFEVPCQDRRFRYDVIDWSQSNLIAVGGIYSDQLQVWDWNRGQFLPTANMKAVLVAWNPIGDLLAAATTSSGTRSFEITLLDTQLEAVQSLSIPNNIRQIAWHPDGQHIYVSAMDELLAGKFWQFNIQSGEPDASLISCVVWREENPSFDCENFSG